MAYHHYEFIMSWCNGMNMLRGTYKVKNMLHTKCSRFFLPPSHWKETILLEVDETKKCSHVIRGLSPNEAKHAAQRTNTQDL